MASKGLKVLFVTAEVAPFSAIGGLSQVSYFLPKALLKSGTDIRIFTPKYGSIKQSLLKTDLLIEGLSVPTGEEKNSDQPFELVCNVRVLRSPKKGDPVIYFLENMEYYEKRANVYNYSDDHIRFGLLSRAALEFIKSSKFIPDLIHVNDWHTGYLPNYLSTVYQDDPHLKHVSSLLSIHNLYQGVSFDFDHASEMDFDDGKGPLAPFFSDKYLKQNPLKRGFIHADIVNTVSQTYSREIMTEEYGYKLHSLFKELRGKLFGVLNGIDYSSFNPKTDKTIKSTFSTYRLSDRNQNKVDLQKEFDLTISPSTPILSILGRLDDQKGLDLVAQTIDFILSECDVQLVVLGTGDNRFRDLFEELEKKYPGRVGTHLMFDASLPRKIFAGSDMILIPSKYEPGGITAIEAMRYGCIPVVRATGGLADSVVDYNSSQNIGTGFMFKNYSPMSFIVAITRALETYRNSNEWKKIVKRAMDQDFSWEKSAKKYLQLYSRAIEIKASRVSDK